jgi:hypothetical protein
VRDLIAHVLSWTTLFSLSDVIGLACLSRALVHSSTVSSVVDFQKSSMNCYSAPYEGLATSGLPNERLSGAVMQGRYIQEGRDRSRSRHVQDSGPCCSRNAAQNFKLDALARSIDG